jgi:hypothetical protein
MTRKHALIVLFSFCFLFFVGAAIVTAADDLELPPPPDADADLSAPPPPDMGSEEMPPPPDEASADMPPPPDEAGAEDMPPPPEEAGEEPPPPSEDTASEELAPPPGDEGEAPATEEATVAYKVKKGDSLWRISGKDSVYGDAFKWPLVYKANKATIEDPDLIYPKQKLDVKKDYPENVVEDAVDKAKETPPYEPHTNPRKKLPIKY